MVEIKSDRSLIISKGDHFELNALLKNRAHIPGDRYYLAIKDGGSTVITIQGGAVETEDGVRLHFAATTEQMRVLAPRRYIYDVHIDGAGEKTTVMFVANFDVREVAHHV